MNYTVKSKPIFVRIYNVESDTYPKSDDVLNKLRKDRVRFKDETYTFLKTNKIKS